MLSLSLSSSLSLAVYLSSLLESLSPSLVISLTHSLDVPLITRLLPLSLSLFSFFTLFSLSLTVLSLTCSLSLTLPITRDLSLPRSGLSDSLSLTVSHSLTCSALQSHDGSLSLFLSLTRHRSLRDCHPRFHSFSVSPPSLPLSLHLSPIYSHYHSLSLPLTCMLSLSSLSSLQYSVSLSLSLSLSSSHSLCRSPPHAMALSHPFCSLKMFIRVWPQASPSGVIADP